MTAPRPRLRPLLPWSALLLALVLAAFLGPAACHLLETGLRERSLAEARVETPPPGTVDDASHLEQTRVSRVIRVPRGEDEALAVIRAALAEARASGLHVSISGTRHTMGGQTIAPGGLALDMLDLDALHFDPATGRLHAQAGATWAEVLAFLDPLGLSVAVMQSYSVFSVGGSLSVNCHGWQPSHAPIASTVHALTLVRPDGEKVRCSRDENAELFGLVLGGYGLFGVILEAELDLVPNAAYRVERFVVPAERYLATLEAQVWDAPEKPGLAFGRLCVAPESFLREAILTVFLPVDASIPPLEPRKPSAIERTVFRGSVGDDHGKELRCTLERNLGWLAFKGLLSRNHLLDEDLASIENRDPRETDILQEYFVPAENLPAFLELLRTAIPRHGADLLNVTLRDVLEDQDTFLRYADRRMIALVLYLHQPRTLEADERMGPLTRELIDGALALEGRYYLPYRLHATREQFHTAYPGAAAFFEAKRRVDPDELFTNKFYDTYGR